MKFKPILFKGQLYFPNSQLLMQREMHTNFNYVMFQNLYWERPDPEPSTLESPNPYTGSALLNSPPPDTINMAVRHFNLT